MAAKSTSPSSSRVNARRMISEKCSFFRAADFLSFSFRASGIFAVMVFMSYRMYYDGSPVVKGGLFSKPIRPPGHLRCASYATPVASVGLTQISPRKTQNHSRTPSRQNAQSNSRRNAASLRALRYEPEARLKNGSSRRLTLPYSRPARQRDTPQKNDFAVHDFAKPSPALIETPLHDPRGSAPAAQALHGLNVAACRKSSTFLVATMAPCLTAMASIKLSQSA